MEKTNSKVSLENNKFEYIFLSEKGNKQFKKNTKQFGIYSFSMKEKTIQKKYKTI